MSELDLDDPELLEEARLEKEKLVKLEKEEHAQLLKDYQAMILKKEEGTRLKLRKRSYEELLNQEVNRAESNALSSVSIGNMGLIVTKSNGTIMPVQVFDDKKLIADVYGEKKEFAIFHEPITCFMNMRNYWIVGGFVQKIKFYIAMFWLKMMGMATFGLLKFNLFLFRADGEYTLEPSQDLTPLELQRMVEAFLKVANPELQGKSLANMLRGLGDPEEWWKTAQWLITILLIVAMFLFVMNGGI